MTKRSVQTSADVGGGGSTITKPGTYHCQILQSADGASTKGTPISGCSALLTVLDGTEPDQVEKQFHLTLFDPDLSKAEANQEWSRKKQTAYAIAINQVDPAKLGESCELDFDAGEGQQIIIGLELNEYEGKTNLQLAWANIYHVDDPRAKDFPKNKEALGLLPPTLRRKAEFFAALSKKLGESKPAANRLDEAALADL